MPKCNKCGSKSTRHKIATSYIHDTSVVVCACLKCANAWYVSIPDYIPVEQYKRYVNAKV